MAAGPPSPASCSPPLTLPAGQVLIAETLPTGTVMTAVSTLPSTGLLVASNLAAGTATVTVIAGAQTIATFTDAVAPTTGFLQICKVAGTGIVVGSNFTFNVAGTPVTVPAGPAPGGSCGAPLVLPAGPVIITETLPMGLQLTAVRHLAGGIAGEQRSGGGPSHGDDRCRGTDGGYVPKRQNSRATHGIFADLQSRRRGRRGGNEFCVYGGRDSRDGSRRTPPRGARAAQRWSNQPVR